jgi:hypothetical protein
VGEKLVYENECTISHSFHSCDSWVYDPVLGRIRTFNKFRIREPQFMFANELLPDEQPWLHYDE